MTFAMFTLVVFTLVVGAVISGSFIRSVDNVEKFGGGFDVARTTAPTNPVVDMDAAIRQRAGSTAQIHGRRGAIVLLVTEARQAGYGGEFADYPVRGLDRAYLGHTTFGIGRDGARLRERRTSLARDAPGPRLAVVDATSPPGVTTGTSASPPDFQLHGFVLRGRRLRAVHGPDARSADGRRS